MTMQATKQAARRAPCARLRAQAQALARFIRWAPVRVWLSAAVMGLGQLCYGQIIKGLLFMGLEAAGIWYFIARGARDFIGFFILGTQEEDLWMGIKGDNSMNMPLRRGRLKRAKSRAPSPKRSPRWRTSAFTSRRCACRWSR